MSPVLSLITLHVALAAPAAAVQPLTLHLRIDSLDADSLAPAQKLRLLAQGPAEPDQQNRERERFLAVHIEELNLKLSKVDTTWPLLYRGIGWGGGVLAASGLVAGAVLAGYGYTPALTAYVLLGAALIAAGAVGIVLVALAIIMGLDRTEGARTERNRLLEEKMRAEAELQYLRGMPRPGF